MRDTSHLKVDLPVDFIDEVTRATSIEAVLTHAAQWLPKLFAAERCKITFMDDDGAQICRMCQPDAATDAFGEDTIVAPGSPRNEVLLTGKPLFLDHADLAALHSRAARRVVAAQVQSVLIAPMSCGNDTIGTISLLRSRKSEFSDEEIALITSVGKWIGSQARLMQEVRNTVRLAETDALTGLANRARLMRVLDGPGSLHLPSSNGRIIGLLHVDLDHFKEVNDTSGHAVGDAILKHAAAAMRAACAPKDLVARIGGDEFVVVTRTDPAGYHLARLAARIARSINQPIRVGDVEARVGASVGTAMAQDASITADRLIGNADIALYEVKRRGRGGVRAFSPEMRRASERRSQLLTDLETAIRDQAFEPFFQPQVSFETGRFVGFEMLARWNHPGLGMLDPDEFIKIAAEAGLSDKVDRIVRDQGLTALRKLRAAGWSAPKMAFNASAQTLSDPDLVENLLWEVHEQGLSPNDLVIEIGEVDLPLMDNPEILDHVNQLTEAGFEVELDDFGAGYSALAVLSRLTISAIKLDCKIIAPLPDPRAEAMISGLIAMARAMKLRVIAEGVETASQFAILRRLDCDIAQGYGVSKPLPLDELMTFMKGYGQAPVALAET